MKKHEKQLKLRARARVTMRIFEFGWVGGRGRTDQNSLIFGMFSIFDDFGCN